MGTIRKSCSGAIGKVFFIGGPAMAKSYSGAIRVRLLAKVYFKHCMLLGGSGPAMEKSYSVHHWGRGPGIPTGESLWVALPWQMLVLYVI